MEKSVRLELDPISVVVNVNDGAKNPEVLELAKKALIKQLEEKFPYFKYLITEGKVIDDSDIFPGRIVKVKSSGDIGIIFEVKTGTKYPIHVTLPNNKLINFTKEALEKASGKMKVEKLIQGRDSIGIQLNEWMSGTTAFFVNGNEIIPVIINKARTKVKAYIVGHKVKGSFYTITPSNCNRLFDSFKEAEGYLKTHSA